MELRVTGSGEQRLVEIQTKIPVELGEGELVFIWTWDISTLPEGLNNKSILFIDGW